MTIKAQIEALGATHREKLDEIEAILASAEEGLTEEQDAEIEALQAEADEAKAQIDALKQREERLVARQQQLEESRKLDTGSAGSVRGAHIQTPQAPKQSIIPATARRPATLRAFKGVMGDRDAEERAYRFGQYALAKLRNDLPKYFGNRFNNATQFTADQWGINFAGVQNAAHGEGAGDTTGAHVFVPEEFLNDLIKLREVRGVARSLLRTTTMMSDTKTQPKRTGGLTAYAVGENAAGTESTASYEDVRLTARKWMVIARMSSELDEDSVISFGDELADEISYAFADKEDEAAFNGDGTSTYHGILGIRNRLDTLTAGTAPGLILGDGNLWSELTLANHQEVIGGLPQFADGPGAVWVCHRTYFYTVMQTLATAAGGTTANEIVNGVNRPTFLGYPVFFSQVFPSTEANSQIPVVFGNIGLGAIFGDRRMETIDFTDTAVVNSESLWERDQIGVRGTERFDVAVHGYGSDTEAGPICGLETASS